MTNEKHSDSFFIQKALKLAIRGRGRTKSNPIVGCVIVKNGSVISTGFHAAYGGPHGEAVALAKAGSRARGSTAFVTLEPCVDFPGKKTPACSTALVRAGVKRVVIAMRDVNPLVAGKGIALLRKSGIEVKDGVLEKEAAAINKPFLKMQQTGLPYVVLKLACSSDGFLGSAKVKRISGAKANLLVQKMRNELDAILVGVGTILADNPRLTCRIKGGRDPLRVIIDSDLRSPLNSRVFDDSNCVVFAAKGFDGKKAEALMRKGVKVFAAGKKRVDLKLVLKTLAGLRVSSLLVEGGSKIASSFINNRLVDEFVLIVSPRKLGSGVPLFSGSVDLSGLKLASVEKLGRDSILVFESKKPSAFQ